MLTKEQIELAELAALEIHDTGTTALVPVPEPKLAVTVELELGAAQELSMAVQCLQRGDRQAARGHISRAGELLNEAEIED